MNRYLLSLFLWLFFLAGLSAQTVEWSNQQKQKSKNMYTSIIGESNSSYYLLRAKDNEFNREMLIEKYRSNLALDVSKDLWQPPASTIQKVILQPSGILVFCTSRNNTTEKYEMLTWRLDGNLNITGTPQKLFQIESGQVRNGTTYYIKESPDKEKFFIMYLMKSMNNETSVLAVHCYTKDMQQVYNRYYPVEYEYTDVFITSFDCDNDGNAFVLIDFPASPGKRSKTRKFFLYQLAQNDNDLTEISLNNDSNDIVDIGMVVNAYAGHITISGFYRSLGKENSIDGIFLCGFDSKTKVFKPRRDYAFDKSLIAKAASVIANESSPGLSDLIIRKLIPRSDGGCMVLAEKFYETKQTYTYYLNGFPQTSTRTVYNFDEVVIFSLQPDGRVQFNEVIKKRQSSINDGGYYSSFVTLNTNSSIALIYSLDATAESDIMITSITPKGEIDTRILIKAMSYYVSLMPPESKQISANSSLICAMKDRKFSIMKVTY